MDEDPSYSSLVFKNTTVTQKEQDDQTIYSEVKSKKPVTTAPIGEKEQKIVSKVQLKASGFTAPEAETAAKRPTRVLLVCLGTLCVLLMVAVVVLLIQITKVMESHGATIEELRAKIQNRTDENKVLMNERQQLMEAQRNLANQTEELSKERNHLNRSLEVILTFDLFPVNTFCPNKKCLLCRAGWILFQEMCYLFYEETSPWKTWNQSRQFCKTNAADLVVINNLQEQIFLSNHTKYYFGPWQGYWMGLRKISQTWMWVDGHNDTLRFWMNLTSDQDYALLMPDKPPAQSWRPENITSEKKFICKHETLIWPI
ncbi:C-type lectin domain family 17, member A-like [Nematolebias whitei]|uniref:C-type lectin domain family 17, member A-like n=1 Tax=Nematolebias whitei TaxID=451745 RepID=UPI00189B87D0|nr:C-type lectin domain family 17, member A-like [Nematolebias whitei]